MAVTKKIFQMSDLQNGRNETVTIKNKTIATNEKIARGRALKLKAGRSVRYKDSDGNALLGKLTSDIDENSSVALLTDSSGKLCEIEIKNIVSAINRVKSKK